MGLVVGVRVCLFPAARQTSDAPQAITLAETGGLYQPHDPHACLGSLLHGAPHPFHSLSCAADGCLLEVGLL